MASKRVIPIILLLLLGGLCWQLYKVREQNRLLAFMEKDIKSLEARKRSLEHGWWNKIPSDGMPMLPLTDTYLPLMDYIEFCKANYGMRISLSRENKGQVNIDNILPVEYSPVKLMVQYNDLGEFMQFFDMLLRGFPIEVTGISWKGGKVEITAVLWGRI